jgi:hypothetical protein
MNFKLDLGFRPAFTVCPILLGRQLEPPLVILNEPVSQSNRTIL